MKTIRTLGLGAVLCTPLLANAGLIGDTVQFEGCFPDLAECAVGAPGTIVTSGARVITADASDAFVYGAATVDVNDSSISLVATFGYATGVSFNGITISDLDWFGEPDRFLSGFSTPVDTFEDLQITFTDDSITINLSSALNAGVPGNALIELITDVADPDPDPDPDPGNGGPGNAVPVPASIFLMALGLVGLRRRRNA